MECKTRRGALPLALGLLALLPALLPAAARAESGMQVTPSAGIFLGGGFYDRATGEDLLLGESPGFGITFSLPASPVAHYELLYRYQRADLETADVYADPPRLDLDVHYLQIGSTYEFPQARVRPYIAAGAGLTALAPSGEETSAYLSLSLGGGVKIPFSARAGLRLEGRGYLTVLPSSTQIFCAGGGGGGSCAFGVAGDSFGQFELQAGIYFEL